MKPEDYLESYEPDMFSRVIAHIDPVLLSDFDPDDADKIEKELRDEKQNMEQKYREHDETIKELLKMTGLSKRQIKKCESFVKRHNKIISENAWNWRSQESRLKKKWRYRSILACFSEPYCKNMEHLRIAESFINSCTQRLEELKCSVEQGEEKKRRFILKYYAEKWSALAVWND